MAPELLRRLVSVSLSGACLLVVAEGCLWLLRGVLTPNQRRVVWILVLLRLLCPWSFSGGLLDWAAEETRVPSPTTVFVPSAEPIAHPQMDAVQEMQSPVPLETGLVLVWAAGALAVLTRRGNDYVRFRRAVQAGQRPAGGAWQAVYTRLTVKDLRPPRLAISSAVPGPMLVGLVRPRILLPNQDILSQEEQEDVLSHELTHWRRKDLWWKWLAMMAVAVHWFNPAAWRLLERLDRDSELSCDWIVVRHWDAARRTRYGALLLRLAAGGMHTPSAALFSQKQRLKERLISIMQPKKDNQKGMVLGAAVCLALILTSTALGVYTGPEDATASLPPSAPETLSWPLALGDSVTLSAKFETRVHPITQKEISHDGIDIPQPAGTPVLAAADGIVLEAGFNITDGNYILLQHADLTTQYAHLQEISVEPGETVSTGEEIGTVGKTGMATGEHLHFGVLQDGVPIDPLEYLDSAAAAQLPSA